MNNFKYKSVVEGKEGIVARVVADSISETGKRITTFELEYPRFIHGEIMTHRQFSRNAMSSRAIPVQKQIEQVLNNSSMPVFWGKNQSGMSAKEECFNSINDYKNFEWWGLAALSASRFAQEFANSGYHKQIVNRLLEPWQRMKTVLTSTEFDNFFKLRLAPDAQPEIQELAKCMKKAMDESVPEVLKAGEWHTPYVEHWEFPSGDGSIVYVTFENNHEKYLTLEEALAISTSCCAQVSYRNIDNSYEKAMDIYEKLGLNTDHAHLSPTEHQATPMKKTITYCPGGSFINTYDPLSWESGITHVDKNYKLWSGNFMGWIQHRQKLLDN